MTRSIKQYNPDFKVKVVLEVLKEEQTINQIASKHQVIPKNIINWKKQFLENAELAFNKEMVVKEYKQKIKEMELEKEDLYKEIGKLTQKLTWAEKKIEKFAIV